MLEHITTTKKDENLFIMYFVDRSKKEMSETHYKRLKWYTTHDNSKINVNINVNSMAGSFIDVTIKYSQESINNSNKLDELIEKHEKEFPKFYNDSLSY
ncbi:hypothetical protein [Methanobacterium sp. MBAC-LM]|uniref:hypothetical protein n=1 Tax=Methanobacterium sp. MBAC-LM TaxID=3412034 RepID=UPI003C796897